MIILRSLAPVHKSVDKFMSVFRWMQKQTSIVWRLNVIIGTVMKRVNPLIWRFSDKS